MDNKLDTQRLMKSGMEILSRQLAQGAIPAEQVAEQAQPTNTPSGKGKLLGLLGGLVKTAAPAALSMIPGVGGIAANIFRAVTANDDEWFDEFKGCGAAFNELLKESGEQFDSGTNFKAHIINNQASVAIIPCGWNSGNDVEQEILPSILAYVRKKTNNVLMDASADYWRAFSAIVDLHAIYYTIRKYVELGVHIPVNIPALPGLLPQIKPEVYNQLVGIADTLESYLKTTTGMPYALAAYVRWRFGTTFYSDNTGKPGLILYDANAGLNPLDSNSYDATTIIPAISAAIDTLKRQIANCGRAAADFHTAYEGNGVEYTVPIAHYDAKEYNLRVNLAQIGQNYASMTNKYRIVLDSRLDMNAAVQAVTISTSENAGNTYLVPFPITDIRCYLYNPARTFVQSSGVDVVFTNLWNLCKNSHDDDWAGFSFTDLQNTPFAVYEYDLSLHTTAITTTAYMYNVFKIEVARGCFTSLQFHNVFRYQGFGIKAQNGSETNYCYFFEGPIAYDTAYLSDHALASIHRTALRNLTRGDYTRKKEVKTTTKEFKEASSEVVEELLPDKVQKTI